MGCQQGTPYCLGCPHITATFLAVTGPPDVNGDLTQVHITGKKVKSVVSFLEEGLYILCDGRAVQIAAPYCELRDCERALICSCKDPNSTTDKIFPLSYNSRQLKDWTLVDRSHACKPCNSCLYDWLNLRAVYKCAQKHDLQLLRAPRTLFATLQMDRIVMAYDDELSLDRVWDNFMCIDLSLDVKQCPSHIITWMLEAWHDFLNQNGYPSDNSFATSDEISESKDDWDWDDCGAPTCARSHAQYAHIDRINDQEEEELRATESPEPGFDLFNDIIEEEFPKIHKNPTSTSTKLESNSKYEDANPDTAVMLEHGVAPVPLVIHPKGL